MEVLVIDDSESKVLRVKEALTKCDITIIDNWREGMVSIKEDNPQLIILDMNMPRYKNESVEAGIGVSILKEMNRKGIKTPVIVYSTDDRDYSMFKNVIGVIQLDSMYSINSELNSILIHEGLKLEEPETVEVTELLDEKFFKNVIEAHNNQEWSDSIIDACSKQSESTRVNMLHTEELDTVKFLRIKVADTILPARFMIDRLSRANNRLLEYNNSRSFYDVNMYAPNGCYIYAGLKE